MLYTLAVVLIVLWLLGYATSSTMGGLIHVLLVIAVIVIPVRLITGRKPVWNSQSPRSRQEAGSDELQILAGCLRTRFRLFP